MKHGKKGNECHSNLWDVMGNKSHQESSGVYLMVNGHTYLLPSRYFTKAGKLRKDKKHVVAELLLNVRREKARIAA